MIRVLLYDDHPAMRAGLATVLAAEPGLTPVGAAGDEPELWHLLERGAPDVLLLDYHLPQGDGLTLCRRLKRRAPHPRVVVYSAYADTSLAVAAILAGADGMAHKGAPARELYDLLRRVSRGERVMPPVSADMVHAAAHCLDEEDRPILAMLLDGTPPQEVARVLTLGPATVEERVGRMLGRLRGQLPARTG